MTTFRAYVTYYNPIHYAFIWANYSWWKSRMLGFLYYCI